MIFTGIGAASAFALGFNVVAPLSTGMDNVCDIFGVICLILFFGFADESGSRSGLFLEPDRE
jgi:hypothetical protein